MNDSDKDNITNEEENVSTNEASDTPVEENTSTEEVEDVLNGTYNNNVDAELT